jgi:hypothetical protein
MIARPGGAVARREAPLARSCTPPTRGRTICITRRTRGPSRKPYRGGYWAPSPRPCSSSFSHADSCCRWPWASWSSRPRSGSSGCTSGSGTGCGWESGKPTPPRCSGSPGSPAPARARSPSGWPRSSSAAATRSSTSTETAFGTSSRTRASAGPTARSTSGGSAISPAGSSATASSSSPPSSRPTRNRASSCAGSARTSSRCTSPRRSRSASGVT